MTRKLYTEEKYKEALDQQYSKSDNSSDNETNSQVSDSFSQDKKILDSKIKKLKKEFNDEKAWQVLVTAFKILAEKRDRDSKYLSLFYITQRSIQENWKLLFKHECEILARILYVKLSKRRFKSRINFHQFARLFMGLRDENADRRNKCIFDMMEFNGDGQYDIMYLFQILNNIPRNSLYGREIYKMIKKYKEKNILMRSGYRSQITLNYNLFNSMCQPQSDLVYEFQYRLFGKYYGQYPGRSKIEQQ